MENDVDHDGCSLKRRTVFSAAAWGNQEEEEEEEEDGGDVKKDCNFDVDNACVGSYGRKRRPHLYPPPMPVLARTGSLRCYMPWRLIRFYGEDGRLVIKEVRAKRHDYFLATRCEGRLTLRLVTADEGSPAFARWRPQQEGHVEEEMRKLETITIEPVAENNAAAEDDVPALPSSALCRRRH